MEDTPPTPCTPTAVADSRNHPKEVNTESENYGFVFLFFFADFAEIRTACRRVAPVPPAGASVMETNALDPGRTCGRPKHMGSLAGADSFKGHVCGRAM